MNRILPLAGLLLLASGCGGLQSRAQPERTYLWPEPAVAAVADPALRSPAVALRLLDLTAEPGLRSPRLLLQQPGGRLEPVAGARWSGETPQLLQSMLARGLRDSDRFGQVLADEAGRGASHVAAVHLRQLAAVYSTTEPATEAPLARIVVDVSVSSLRDGRQLASFALRAEAQAGGAREADVAEALGTAVARLATLLPGALHDAIRTSTARSTP